MRLQNSSKVSSGGRKVVRMWKVPGAWPNPLPGTTHYADEQGGLVCLAYHAGCLQQLQRVKLVRELPLGLGGSHQARRQLQPREEVHGALGRLARRAPHALVEHALHLVSAHLQRPYMQQRLS